ncbi:MAG: universal stress protein [Methylophilaceae bacterium]|nr:universal stress protein [Methylophilaceae bacterium]
MPYQTLMVHMQLGSSNTAMLNIANELAHHFHADIIGIAAGQPTQMVYGLGYPILDFINQEHAKLEKEILEAENAFKLAFKAYPKTSEWRSMVTLGSCASYIAMESRSADLLITEISPNDFYKGPNGVNAGEIILQCGRPVIVVPENTTTLTLENIVVGWKDTREARRAISDALPLFKLAKKITVIELSSKNEVERSMRSLQQVVNWLMRHDITASYENFISEGDVKTQLLTLANHHNADILIAGAYGHSRAYEWAFGGVTNELLRGDQFCSLLSH